MNRSSPNSRKLYNKILITFLTLLLVGHQPFGQAYGLWWFSDLTTRANEKTTSNAKLIDVAQETIADVQQPQEQPKQQQQQQDVVKSTQAVETGITNDSPFTIAGIRPSGIASLLNTVSETGFQYFNVHDQCRSRTACDVGYMLYKKLNFVHNWIIRTSVRTLVDSNNVYAHSWSTGMMGKNCTLVYPACNQSPIESFMNFALLAA